MPSRPPGKFEFDLLQFLSQHDGLSVRDLHELFGKPQGYIRGTIVKSMDRLLKKRLVKRELIEGTFVYQAKHETEDLDRQLVESFIKDRLGGRIKPIALFLSEAKGLDHKELQQLKALLEKLDQ